MGIKKYRAVSSGSDAKSVLENKEYDVIVTDWQMPSGSGLALVNTIQLNEENPYQAVVVHSGFLKSEDMDFLREFPCVSLITKPAQYLQMREVIFEVYKKSMWYKSRADIVSNALSSLVTNKKSALNELRGLLDKVPDRDVFAMIIGKKLMILQDYAEAENFFREAYYTNSSNVLFVNHLAKAMSAQNKHKQALEILDGDDLNEHNYERFFLLGETSLKDMNPGKAEEYFLKALKIDPDAKSAKDGVKVSNSIQRYNSQTSMADLPQDYASLLNNTGVSLAQAGQPDEAIDFYQKALKFISDEDTTMQISFNLALAYAKTGQTSKAKPIFAKVAKSKSTVAPKAKKYVA